MEINEKLAEVLAWTGKTQKYLADQLGIPKGSMNAYMSGRVGISIDIAYKIADALGVTPWTILSREPLSATSFDLSKKEIELVTSMRGLNNEQREVIFQTVELFEKHNKEKL